MPLEAATKESFRWDFGVILTPIFGTKHAITLLLLLTLMLVMAGDITTKSTPCTPLMTSCV